jgi:hypothetical protein
MICLDYRRQDLPLGQSDIYFHGWILSRYSLVLLRERDM